MIRLIVAEDYNQLSQQAAQIVAQQIKQNPASVIGFATGSTPLGLYQELVAMYQKKELSFDHITSFNLDEYIGLDRNHPQSYYRFMWDHLFSHVGVEDRRINFPPGIFQNEQSICERYEAEMAKCGGIDLQILGIGVNGHIGFNEPSDSFTLSTHIVELAEETIQANARFFDNEEEVPRYAITMGVRSIMQARSILLLASGENKAEAIQKMFTDKADPQIPASILQLHANVTLVVDKAAASSLPEGSLA
ncbi:glucosamine-6-phosphate deaminase [Brevibacillus ginsengisoli]|uniref:glucosamine-6-phosphate deaminase n=1 Tax=Brevibacillus ginsengisoli TaxID=363854 RepID=UPI003CF357E0